MSRPHITADARLSTTALSFTTGPNPDLIVSLRLGDAEKPITIAKSTLPQLFITTNAIVLHDATRQQDIILPTLDINMRSAPPLSLVPEMAAKFVTLEPGVSCDILKVPFRPLGSRRRGVEGTNVETVPDKYLFAQVGMHMLESGRDYTVKVREGLRVDSWMEGRLDELIQGGSDWRPNHGEISILPTESFHFRVET